MRARLLFIAAIVLLAAIVFAAGCGMVWLGWL